MITENEEGRGVYNSFNEWAAQLYHIRIIQKINTDYLRTLRQELLCVISRTDNKLNERGHSRGWKARECVKPVAPYVITSTLC